MTEVTLAAVCMNVAHNKEANLEKYIHFIEEAASCGASLLVFPEVSLQGYLKKRGAPSESEVMELTRYYRETAETVPGPSTELIGKYATRYNMYIQIGMAEAARAGQVFYNSAVLVGPEGVVGVFRKLHDRGEWPVFCSGDEFPMMETAIGKLGAFVCYDMCFPETIRSYAVRGAIIASMSTAWPLKDPNALDPDADHYAYVYDTLTRAHAIAGILHFIQSGRTNGSI
jgi:predicted amidohydrolase